MKITLFLIKFLLVIGLTNAQIIISTPAINSWTGTTFGDLDCPNQFSGGTSILYKGSSSSVNGFQIRYAGIIIPGKARVELKRKIGNLPLGWARFASSVCVSAITLGNYGTVDFNGEASVFIDIDLPPAGNSLTVYAAIGAGAVNAPPYTGVVYYHTQKLVLTTLPPAPPPSTIISGSILGCENSWQFYGYSDLGSCYTNSSSYLPQYYYNSEWLNFEYVATSSNGFSIKIPELNDGNLVLQTRILASPICPNMLPIAVNLNTLYLYTANEGSLTLMNSNEAICTQNKAKMNFMAQGQLASKLMEFSSNGLSWASLGSFVGNDYETNIEGFYRVKMTTPAGCVSTTNIVEIKFSEITADFDIIQNTGCNDLYTVSITDNSFASVSNATITGFAVSYDNGITWTNLNTFSYSSGGVKIIRYKSNFNGCWTTDKIKTIDVKRNFEIDFTVLPSCSNATTIKNTSIANNQMFQAVNFEFFIDGNSVYNGLSDQFTTLNLTAGSHLFKMRVTTNNACLLEIEKTILINKPLITDFTFNFLDKICVEDLKSMAEVKFLDASLPNLVGTKFRWRFLNLALGTFIIDDQHEFIVDVSNVNEGIYELMLETENAFGCKSFKTQTIEVFRKINLKMEDIVLDYKLCQNRVLFSTKIYDIDSFDTSSFEIYQDNLLIKTIPNSGLNLNDEMFLKDGISKLKIVFKAKRANSCQGIIEKEVLLDKKVKIPMLFEVIITYSPNNPIAFLTLPPLPSNYAYKVWNGANFEFITSENENIKIELPFCQKSYDGSVKIISTDQNSCVLADTLGLNFNAPCPTGAQSVARLPEAVRPQDLGSGDSEIGLVLMPETKKEVVKFTMDVFDAQGNKLWTTNNIDEKFTGFHSDYNRISSQWLDFRVTIIYKNGSHNINQKVLLY